MSIEALEHYLDAKEALAEGDHDKAAEQLGKALGSPQDNSVLRLHVEKFLNHHTFAGVAALEILRVEVQRRS